MFAGGREGKRPIVALQQLYAKLVLQLFDMLGDGGLRDKCL